MSTWDKPKRQTNIQEHRIDLAECDQIFDAPMLTWEDDTEAYGEQRLCSLGMLKSEVVFLV